MSWKKPHLKLVVMHDFMWALIEEQASNRAHQHQVRNQDSRHNIRVVESEAHGTSQSIISHAFDWVAPHGLQIHQGPIPNGQYAVGGGLQGMP